MTVTELPADNPSGDVTHGFQPHSADRRLSGGFG
jgi:hypothetical protein